MRHCSLYSLSTVRWLTAGVFSLMIMLGLPWQSVVWAWQPVESEPQQSPAGSDAEPVDGTDTKYQTFNEAFGVGATFYNSRNFSAARGPLEAALRMAPDDAARLKVYEALIACYRLEKKSELMMEAVEYVLKNSQRDAQKSLTSRSFLSFLYQRGEIPEAVKRYEQWLEKDPNDPVALLLLSEIYTRIQQNPKRAAELLERLRKITPVATDDPAAVMQQARLASQFIRARDYKNGAQIYEQLVDKDSKLAGYYLKEAAMARMKLGEKDTALILARRAVEAGPDTRTEQLTHFWSRQLGEFLLEHGEPAEAIPLLKQALKTTQIEGYLKDTQAKLEEAQKKAGVQD